MLDRISLLNLNVSQSAEIAIKLADLFTSTVPNSLSIPRALAPDIVAARQDRHGTNAVRSLPSGARTTLLAKSISLKISGLVNMTLSLPIPQSMPARVNVSRGGIPSPRMQFVRGQQTILAPRAATSSGVGLGCLREMHHKIRFDAQCTLDLVRAVSGDTTARFPLCSPRRGWRSSCLS